MLGGWRQALPFLDDLQRRGELGIAPAAVELAVGILRGLYGCRDGEPDSLLEYSADYASERASDVVISVESSASTCPSPSSLDLMPAWSTVLRRRN